jgi:tRNA 5-methylaminomethyl-2-thiouridine biosynthesis bifunctional protein
MHTVGATLQHDDEDSAARSADDLENLARLHRLLPGFADGVSALISGRVGWRATTQDRLPLVGKLAPGLYASLGHGARGITCAPLCGEFLAAMICDEPLPLGAEWVERLDPMRMAHDGAE